MQLDDYRIDTAGRDWAKLLGHWSGILPETFTLWLVNRFGDAFLVLDDESVHLLDVGVGSFTRVAESRDHFATLLDQGDHASEWFLIPLVRQCVDALPPLQPTQCYGFKVPPLLGGEYRVENVVPVDLEEHYRWMAELHARTKDLPDGSRVRMRVVE